MKSLIDKSFTQLTSYCESEDFKGWDPFDGLTSRFFQAIPFVRTNKFCRLAWIQFFKRSPVNFRRLFLVKKQHNSKGLALFIIAYCNMYEKTGDTAILAKINTLCDRLIRSKCQNYAESCWGYYFDWQARAFFQPAYTPTVVATSFGAEALYRAFRITGNDKYKEEVISAAGFVANRLNRTYDNDGDLSFSYSPLDKTAVFNASLLGARLLAQAHYLSENAGYSALARQAVSFACKYQQADGAWAYGTLPFHSWIDNFHTGFNLEAISDYQRYTGDLSFSEPIRKGLDYYIRNFFTAEGIPKYYNTKMFPIDVHATAQLIVTLSKLEQLDEHRAVADNVLKWTIEHMQDKKGYFYYQKNKNLTNKIAYMRWSQAWMMYGFSYYK